jgi:hypothetical protein
MLLSQGLRRVENFKHWLLLYSPNPMEKAVEGNTRTAGETS